MTPEDSSDEKRVWLKRAPDQRQLFASVDKWLAFLPYLSKPELDKCREVCEWTNRLIEKHSGGELKQRRHLISLAIAPYADTPDSPYGEMTLLDMDKWMEDPEEMEKIETKAKQLIGERVYPYEPEDATVRIVIEPQLDQRLYLDVKNRLDEKDALLIARLMPRITPPMAVFREVFLSFLHTPELPADAPDAELYFNPALFSLPSNADGSGGGSMKLITHYLHMHGWYEEYSPQGMIKAAELTVQCEEFFKICNPANFAPTLRLVSEARPLNAPARIYAAGMEDGRLDEMLNFFTHTVPGFESTVPLLDVTIVNTAAWPESLPKESAINPREEQLAEKLYKFRRYNDETGEKLEVEVRGFFGNIEDEGKGEDCLRVFEMVLHFRLDDADK